MKDLGMFLSNLLIEKFDFKRLMVCLCIVLTLMLVPKINILFFLMPLDNAEKRIWFIFALIVAYVISLILTFLWKNIRNYFRHKPKKLFRSVVVYGEYINHFYSERINEYSAEPIDIHGIMPNAVIYKLLENNIIAHSGYDPNTYCLTSRAIKKLTRIRKICMFIDSKINKQEDNPNG